MRSFILPAVVAALVGTAAMPAAAQRYERERDWFGDSVERFGNRVERLGERVERFGERQLGLFDERDRFERDDYEREDYEREDYERGYRLGREDERRRYGYARFGDREIEDRREGEWFSGGDGLFD